ETVNRDPINWDNMDALQEDAQLCGAVIDAASGLPAIDDCDLSDSDVVIPYSTTGANTCKRTYNLDLDALVPSLGNLNLGLYSDPANKGLYQRRVIYLKVPVKIQQKDGSGLLSTIGATSVRRNLPLMFVSEDKFVFQPWQLDEPVGPLADPP